MRSNPAAGAKDLPWNLKQVSQPTSLTGLRPCLHLDICYMDTDTFWLPWCTWIIIAACDTLKAKGKNQKDTWSSQFGAVCWQPWRLSWSKKKLYVSPLDVNFLAWCKQLRLSIVTYTCHFFFMIIYCFFYQGHYPNRPAIHLTLNSWHLSGQKIAKRAKNTLLL